MPRPKKPSRTKITVEVDREKMMHLLNWNLCLDFDRRPKLARMAWERWRSKIMPLWIEVLPGCRPWGWWTFEAKEVRRAIQGVSIYDRRPDILHTKYAFGIPVAYDYTPDGEPIETTFESEADYLARLGLLTDAEKKMPMEALRRNSCDYIRRFDLAPVEKVLQRLGDFD